VALHDLIAKAKQTDKFKLQNTVGELWLQASENKKAVALKEKLVDHLLDYKKIAAILSEECTAGCHSIR
jgi:hypothetical protein